MRSPRSLPLKAMTEKQWTVEVARLAKDFGWLRYHTHRSDFSPAGFPDECLVRPPRLIFAELKSDNPHSKLGPEQERWREQLQEVPGVEWYLWRPSDVDEVIRLLVPPGWKFT